MQGHRRAALTQAAQILGAPASTVRNHYQRAKEELRRVLAVELVG